MLDKSIIIDIDRFKHVENVSVKLLNSIQAEYHDTGKTLNIFRTGTRIPEVVHI